jgi:WD40 repeat protein
MTSLEIVPRHEVAPVADGPSARFSRSLAVIIGIDTYGGDISPLRSAVADARAIAEALQRDHGFEIWCLFDERARRADLVELLHEKLPATLGPSDRLLFYFAGHGIALDGDTGPAGYLVPFDARRSDPEGFLPMHVLHEALSRLPVHHALIILDCCFAGAFRWSSLRDIEPAFAKIYRERYDRYLASPAWQVLTSASSDQLALDVLATDRGEHHGTHSPFALALLEGLAGAADYTNDHVITADELAMYVRERVAPDAASVGCRQIPQLFPLDRHDCGQFVFQVPNCPLDLESAPPVDEDTSPYRGLLRFSEQDHSLFFGRGAVTRRLLEAVASRQLTAVIGPSGSGKSSLVHAGVLPALRAQGWTILPPQRPGRSPLAALAALTDALGAPAEAAGIVSAWLAAAAAHAANRPSQPWLVVIDQLEELWTHPTSERDQAELMDALAAALEAAPTLHLVVTVRSDAEPQLHERALGPRWSAARFVVPPMSRDELREIIEEPAIAAVLHFEPSRLVERLIDDVALVPAPLPLLSFALSELYRRCASRWRAGIHDRALRETDYEAMGSVARALTRRATALHDELVAEDRRYATTIRNIFHRMVALVGGERARRRVSLAELRYGDLDEDQRVASALQAFHEARLIALGTERTAHDEPTGYAEPMHDELVRGWPLVSRWLDELDTPPGTRALLAAVGRATGPWQESREDRALLWSDPRAEQAHEICRAQRFIFNASEARFVDRSVRLRRSRRGRLIASVLVTMCLLAGGAALALWQRSLAIAHADRAVRSESHATASAEEAERQRRVAESREEESRRLLARSHQESGRQLLLAGRPQEAIPYLVAARDAGRFDSSLQMLFAAAARHLPSVLLEHDGAVESASVCADGTRIVTASRATARVRDAASGNPRSPPLRHAGDVSIAACSPDGTRILTVSGDVVHVWDAASGRPLLALRHHASVGTAAFSPDSARILTTSEETARVWSATSGRRLLELRHPASVGAAVFSPDGTRIATASLDGIARAWDATAGVRLFAMEHQDAVTSVAISPDGRRIVTASDDDTARIWDAVSGHPLPRPLQHQGDVTGAVFSADGTRVVTASRDSTARVWDAATGAPLATLRHTDVVSRATFSSDGMHVVTASGTTVLVWSALTGQAVGAPRDHGDFVTSVALVPGRMRAVTASLDRTARVWDLAPEPTASPPLQHGGRIQSAAFSPEGRRILTASADNTARIWDIRTGRPAARALRHRGPVRGAVFSPDGTRVLTASADMTARVWHAATGAPITEPLQHRGDVTSIAFSPDGNRVVTASRDGSARIWNAATGAALTPPLEHGDFVTGVAFSPDGRLIVTTSHDHTAGVWAAGSGGRLFTLEHHGLVRGAAFSPDGTRIVTASDDHTARVWDTTTGRPVAAPLRHEGPVASAVFSGDGTRIVTASADHTARVWDAVTAKPAASPLEHAGAVTSAVFSSDGVRVLTAGLDRTARVWDATSGKLLLAPIPHRDAVRAVAFSADGGRLLSVAGNLARTWETPLDQQSLASWTLAATRSPYVLIDGVLSRRR